jgi:hypothetical protein
VRAQQDNIQTLQFLPQAKQLRKARAVLDTFLPIAEQDIEGSTSRPDPVKAEPRPWSTSCSARRFARQGSAHGAATGRA